MTISDERIVRLIDNDPLAYRWYQLASHNGLTEQQFLTELLVAKYSLPAALLADFPTFEDSKKAADELCRRYGLTQLK
jgi:hypothetical protein